MEQNVLSIERPDGYNRIRKQRTNHRQHINELYYTFWRHSNVKLGSI